jgi:hypothetical protein
MRDPIDGPRRVYRIVEHTPPAVCADVSKISSRLVSESKRFKWGAKRLNTLDAWKRWAPLLVGSIIVAAVIWWRFFL